MAACGYAKPPLSLKSHTENCLSRGPTPSHVLNYGVGNAKLGCSCYVSMKEQRVFVAKGFECGGEEESDEEFVKTLREVQPYMSVHSKKVFVLLLSAEIVASPYLDTILKPR
ncbi:hypothetical protein RJT34_30849 [Clitoria ternatea]|uniref:Uncharacterized protein n=1 Tax=Clitoria ternatea TaxID=43366 RepID=A0AAN9ETK2_CLITE